MCLAVSSYKSSQLDSHFMGRFSDHLVPTVAKERGGKLLSGAEARLRPRGFQPFLLLLLFCKASFKSQLPNA